MPNESCVHSGGRSVVDAKIAQLLVATEKVAFFLVYHEFLFVVMVNF